MEKTGLQFKIMSSPVALTLLSLVNQFCQPLSTKLLSTLFSEVETHFCVTAIPFTPFFDTRTRVTGTPLIVCNSKGGGEHFILGIVDTFVGNARKKRKKWNLQKIVSNIRHLDLAFCRRDVVCFLN